MPNDAEEILPRVLKPLWWLFLSPRVNQELSGILGHSTADNAVLDVFRRLLLTTTFFHSDYYEPSLLIFLKEEFSGRDGNASKSHRLNLLARAYHKYHQVQPKGLEGLAFGGGARLLSDHGTQPFDWIEHPRRRKGTRFARIFDQEMPAEFPGYMKHWAEMCRDILPNFGVSAVRQKVDDLDYWLLYLFSLDKELVPQNWADVKRRVHIRPLPGSRTEGFFEFMETHGGARKFSPLVTLAQAWRLASTAYGFDPKLTCPVDPKEDVVHDPNSSARLPHTRRSAISDEQIAFISVVNCERDFDFARSLKLYDRSVTDRATGKRVRIFWPVIPIILQTIIDSGCRLDSSLWLDSGEGDEFWPAQAKLERNPLPCSISKRQEGFLREFRFRDGTKVVGLHIAKSKTGPYQAPWINDGLAALLEYMRKLQIRFNPLLEPVKATRDKIDHEYSPESAIPVVFPLFRDPRSSSAFPPSQPTVHKYYAALLTECEKRWKEARNRSPNDPGYMPFTHRGKPLWDIHSIRVTFATILFDANVDPRAVMEMMGQKSMLMALYYDSNSSFRTRQEIIAMRSRVAEDAIQRLQKASEEGGEAINLEDLLEGLVQYRSEDHQGALMLRRAIKARAPYEVFAHGICPGADCEQGGPKFKGQFQPVFMRHACSRCRFRVTGSPFLAGLVFRANSLAYHIKTLFAREAELNREREHREDRGHSTAIVAGEIEAARSERMEYAKEWLAELQTIQEAIERINSENDNGDGDGNLPAKANPRLSSQVVVEHDFFLLENLLNLQEIIAGTSILVPDDVIYKRNEILQRIAANNGMEEILIRLPKDLYKKATRAFGRILAEHAGDGDRNPTEQIEALLDGAVQFSSIPALDAKTSKLIEVLTGSDPGKELSGVLE